MSLQVQMIDHVTLVVRDLEASRCFYVDFLGMHLVPRPNFSFEGLWFQAGSTLVHLIKEHNLSGPAGWHKMTDLALGRTHHVAFIVEDGEGSFHKTVQSLEMCWPSP